MKNWYKNQKGSMAIYVTVSVLSFMIILTGIFLMSSSVRKNQLQTILKIKEAYEQDLDNQQEIYSEQVNLKSLSGGNFNIDKGVNTPNLGIGMTPIKWDETANDGTGAWIETTENDDDWYNYSETAKKWANAKTADGSMWVWIPRYAYQIADNYHTTSVTGGTINIKFMKGTTNEAADGTTTWDNASGEGNWNIHPGFEYDKTVSGIWVAKFEASQSDAGANVADYQNFTGGTSEIIKIQPGVNSWRNISIGDAYTKCLEYNTELNSHMMKNTEWGAVAYLAQSIYGKNDEVWINPNANYITGQAGTSVSAEGTTTTYDYTDLIYGVNASTTGTVYGIYDMSGGSGESLSTYLENEHENLTTYGARLLAGDTYTKNLYNVGEEDTGENNYNANIEKYGDAIYETSSGAGNSSTLSWYSDYSVFSNLNNPFFVRGGYNTSGSGAGTFNFSSSVGTADSSIGFRPVLIIRWWNKYNSRARITNFLCSTRFNCTL